MKNLCYHESSVKQINLENNIPREFHLRDLNKNKSFLRLGPNFLCLRLLQEGLRGLPLRGFADDIVLCRLHLLL